jgi:hypothetical protein
VGESKILHSTDEILEELQKFIGSNQTITIHAPVDTPEGQRALVIWRRTLPDGLETGVRAAFGYDLDNALRKALAYEDDFEDTLHPERVLARDKALAENK